MNKIVELLNNKSADEIIRLVIKQGKDPVSSCQQIIDAQVEMQIKFQEVRNKLKELFPLIEVGSKLIAKDDIPNLKIKKDQIVVVSIIGGVMYTLNDDGFDNPIAQASEMIVRSKFRIMKR